MRKFGKRDKFGYMMGDAAGGFVNLYVDVYFLIFCTSVLGIKAAHMGTLYLLARFWDAVNDPMIGWIADRYPLGKSGNRFKPYIKLGMVPLALVGILSFVDVSSFEYGMRMVWVSVAYVLVGSMYTVTSVPYGAMASVITDQPLERAELSKMRSLGGMIPGVIGLSIVPLLAFNKEGDVVPSGFLLAAVIFGVLSILMYTLTIKCTEERVKYQITKTDLKYSEVLKGVARNRPLLGVMVATIGSLIFITGYSQLGAYMFKDYYGTPQILSMAQLLGLPLALIAFLIISPLVKRFGSKKVLVGSISLNLLGAVFMFLVPIVDPMVFLVLSSIFNFSQSLFVMIVWSLVANCIDYQEYLTGKRADGSIYSIYTFTRRIGSTIAGSLAAYVLAWIGYVSGADAQPEAVVASIRLVYTGTPIFVCLLQLVGIGLIYNLTNVKMTQVTQTLHSKHSVTVD